MKVLSAAQMKQADISTTSHQSISSWDLMERASTILFNQLIIDFKNFSGVFCILCGPGNNGGDGLALARILYNAGFQVKVFLFAHHAYSEDNLSNQLRLTELPLTINKFDLNTSLTFPSETVIIDCLFGYGLSRPLDAAWQHVVNQINESPYIIVAVDLPSGLLADKYTDKRHPIVKAVLTYTFQCPKLALLLPENALYSGECIILDIHLDKDFIDQTSVDLYYIERQNVVPLIPQHDRYAHKGTYGHALIAGGSYGKIGSVVLATTAALRTGCGLVTSYIPQCGYTILQSSIPEAMVLTDPHYQFLSTFPEDLSAFNAIGIGMGMGVSENSQEALFNLLYRLSKMKKSPPLVLDADALNILALRPEWLSSVPKDSILTPHPKELQRLLGTWTNDFDKLDKAKTFSKKYNLILLIKGANTAIICPSGQIYFNSTGNQGMATAGSGDVLTGVITALIAQGLTSEQSAIAGVFVHGLAGDKAIQTTHPKSLIASDLVRHISDAWNQLITLPPF